MNRADQNPQNALFQLSQEDNAKETELNSPVVPAANNYCTSGQAARLLGIPDRTVRRYLRTGKIEAVQNPITGTWYISREALIAFVREKGFDLHHFPLSVRVLVVDDETSITGFITRILERKFRNAIVTVTRDPCNALIEIGSKQPDLVILDARMPTLSGRNILSAIKNNPSTKDTKVLAVSGHPADLKELATLGADDTLFKPFSLSKFVEKVERLVPFNQATEA